MSSAKKCDKCGSFYEAPLSNRDVYITVDHHPYNPYIVDLCPDCQKKLRDFIDGLLERMNEKA